MTIEPILIISAVFLLVGIFASKIAVRTGVPALVLFLAIGMLAGSDGPGGVYFDSPSLAQGVGVVALAFILFSGGLDTQWGHMRPVLLPGLSLATIGVIISATLVGVMASQVLGFTMLEGMLLGAIIASTDAAAVFAMLGGRGIALKGKLKPLIELESGSNDPVAVLLTIGVIQLIGNPDLSPIALIPLFLQQMIIGAAVGWLFSRLIVPLINRLRLEFDGLYPVLTIAAVLLTYGVTAILGGSGFLAVYILGIMMGRAEFIHKRSLGQFHDGIAWLMQIVMFVTLGLQVFPSELPAVAGEGILAALFLLFVARPVSVFIALAASRLTVREKLFISWVGLRGATPIVLATFPVLAGVAQADAIFNLVFFIVLISVLMQGTLAPPMARWLGVQAQSQPPSSLSYVMRDGVISNNLREITLSENSPAAGRQIVDLSLPADVLIMLIGRADDSIIPRGSTILEAGDTVLVLARDNAQDELTQIFGD
ncbi:MAG: potassium/proton antiporter [Pleurocapsa minor GSE-CHR-MK-17-07R]|jgi:cell volume regulation protein A|nr:potassium/proton antiporter [Pleurocapsa minor GSE-CHR-MK 17-07R]